jgi:hypothetical protein
VPVAHSCNPSYYGGRDQGELWFKARPGKWFLRPYLKKTYHKKKAGGVAQVVRVPSKPETPSSNPSTAKTN